MNYIFLAAVTGDFSTEHKNLNGLLEALCGLGGAFGTVADKLKEITVDVSTSNIATAINGIGAGLVTFFMVLEIITYCFNVDFHAGFESAMKIGVKTVLMYIIVENCMSASNAVIGVFKLNNTLDFFASFSTIADPLRDMFNNITFSDNFIMKMIEPLTYGIILVILFLVLTVLFSMIIVSLIGIIMEQTVLTTIAPIACATLVNSQVRQTGISALKNLAAISLQWSVIALSFTVYNEAATAINAANFNAINAGDVGILEQILVFVPPLLCMVGLATMISKSGEITRRALGA